MKIYREFYQHLPGLGGQSGQVMLHGVSRDTANIQPADALDQIKGRKFFRGFEALSGGAMLGRLPTHRRFKSAVSA